MSAIASASSERASSSFYPEMDATPVPRELVLYMPTRESPLLDSWATGMVELMDAGTSFHDAIRILAGLPKESKWGDVMMDLEDEERVVYVPPTKRMVEADWKPTELPPRTASAAAVAFGQGIYIHQKAPNCRSGNSCSDPSCTYFHGAKVCEFHAGRNTDNRRRLPDGKSNPNFGKAMACGKGASCPFDHRKPEVIASTLLACQRRDKQKSVPALLCEADIYAAFPGVEWRMGDVFDTGALTEEDRELFIQALEKSMGIKQGVDGPEVSAFYVGVEVPILDNHLLCLEPEPTPAYVMAAALEREKELAAEDDFIQVMAAAKKKAQKRF